MTASSGTDMGADDALFERLADEFTARYRRGERPSIQEFVNRYPHLAEELRVLLPAMVQLEGALEDVEASPQPEPERYPQFQDFVIVREIGRGGMGVVYEAEQVSLGRRIALKVLTQKMLRDARQRLRFEREAKAAARLHHTNIVPVFGFGEHDGTPYYVMQYIEGVGLDAVIEEVVWLERRGTSVTAPRSRTATMMARSLVAGRFSPRSGTETGEPAFASEEASLLDEPIEGSRRDAPGGSVAPPAGEGPGVVSSVTRPTPDPASGSSEARRLSYWQGVARLGVQIGAAIDYAHKNGVLHRDVKPSNLLLDARGTVWVTDFGLAKADDQQNLTLTGDILGTLRYMPPEALEGKSDARGDIYSLGLTLYELLALRPAFDKRDRNQLIKQVTSDEAPRLGTDPSGGAAGPGDDRAQGDREGPGPSLSDCGRAGCGPAAVPRRRADQGASFLAGRAGRAVDATEQGVGRGHRRGGGTAHGSLRDLDAPRLVLPWPGRAERSARQGGAAPARDRVPGSGRSRVSATGWPSVAVTRCAPACTECTRPR